MGGCTREEEMYVLDRIWRFEKILKRDLDSLREYKLTSTSIGSQVISLRDRLTGQYVALHNNWDMQQIEDCWNEYREICSANSKKRK